jgi:peptidoglycan DL-endopeptidase CwlO
MLFVGEKLRFRVPAVGGALVIAVALTVGLASPADAATADGDPSWADVQAAKNNAAAAKVQLDRITASVAALQSQEDAATAAQLQASYAATQATDALDAAQTKLTDLDSQLAAAKKDASVASARFVATAVQLSRVPGGNDLTARLLASVGGKTDLLGRLSSLDQLGKRSAQLEATARQKQNIVTSLEAQASKAQKLRASLKADADTKLAAAQAAQAAAQQAVAAGEARRADLAQKATQLGNAAAAIANTYAVNQAAKTPPVGSGGGSSGGGALDISGTVADPAGAQAYARGAIGRYGWGGDQFDCLVRLWNIESGWRANAYNRSSGAFGIPQALPANKMASAGADWLTNGDTQIDWGLGYIKARYSTPCGALSFETSHVPYWY